MASDYKYHLEDTCRPLGTSLCGHVSYFAASIVTKGQFDLLEPDEQCKRCVGKLNNFTPIRIPFKRVGHASQ